MSDTTIVNLTKIAIAKKNLEEDAEYVFRENLPIVVIDFAWTHEQMKDVWMFCTEKRVQDACAFFKMVFEFATHEKIIRALPDQSPRNRGLWRPHAHPAAYPKGRQDALRHFFEDKKFSATEAQAYLNQCKEAVEQALQRIDREIIMLDVRFPDAAELARQVQAGLWAGFMDMIRDGQEVLKPTR